MIALNALRHGYFPSSRAKKSICREHSRQARDERTTGDGTSTNSEKRGETTSDLTTALSRLSVTFHATRNSGRVNGENDNG